MKHESVIEGQPAPPPKVVWCELIVTTVCELPFTFAICDTSE